MSHHAHILKEFDVLGVWENQGATQKRKILKLLKNLMKNRYESEWKKQIQTSSKLKTYASFKLKFQCEDYLTKSKFSIRRNFTRLRLSAHILQFEVGRHKKIPPEKRFCKFCPNIVEDELHFILQCDKYNTIREPFLRNLVEFQNLPVNSQFLALMKYDFNSLKLSGLLKFINDCFEIRSGVIDT